MSPELKKCVKCPHRQAVCVGPCVCTIDGRDVREHAIARACPKGLYAGAMGDIPDDWNPKDYALDSRGTEGCGCA